jgi:hypothetical protein
VRQAGERSSFVRLRLIQSLFSRRSKGSRRVHDRLPDRNNRGDEEDNACRIVIQREP